MQHVYVIKSQKFTDKIYIGCTNNIDERLKEHNAEKVTSTKRYVPWELGFYIAFKNRKLAWQFEKYLKSHSGRAFMRKRLLD